MTNNDTLRHTRTMQTLERVYEYDMSSVVNRFCKDYGVSAKKSNEYEVELKRYLTLCAFSDINYGIAGGLDYL